MGAYKQQSAMDSLRRQRKEREEKKIHPLEQIKEDEQENKVEDVVAVNGKGKGNENEKQQADAMNATLVSCEQNLIVRLNELTDMMQLYLQNNLTQRILIKPILSNIQSAFIQLRKIVIETKLDGKVKLGIVDRISHELQGIVQKTSR